MPRKQTPIAIKEMRGTARPDRDNFEQVRPAIIKEPPPLPPGVELGDYGKQVWWNTIEYLGRYNVLAEGDLLAVARYCQAEEIWQEAQRDIRANGIIVQIETNNGIIPRRNPAVDIASQQYAIIKDAVARFGLTPSDRRSIVPIEKGKEEGTDEWGL